MFMTSGRHPLFLPGNMVQNIPGNMVHNIPGNMVHNRGEVGWTVELYGLQTLVVGLQDSLDAVTVGVLHVAILEKHCLSSV